MLQQTQVARVIPKYREFLARFPSVRSLARAPLKDVLLLWQGLGYNKRARMLHAGARYVVRVHGGVLPKDKKELMRIPGIGEYTAGAILVFAFNKREVLIETNIRTVFTHHFFPQQKNVRDAELLPLIKKTLPAKDPSAWYSALMDYGALLKRSGVRINAKNPSYRKQTRFKGSVRQARGLIVRELLRESVTQNTLKKRLTAVEEETFEKALSALCREGVVVAQGCRLAIAYHV